VPSKSPRSTVLPVLPIILAAVLVKAALAIGFWLWHDYTHSLDRSLRDQRNLAVMLEGQFERTVQSIDLVLKGLQATISDFDTWNQDGKLRIPATRQLRARMLAQIALLPQAFEIVIADHEGKAVVSTAATPTPASEAVDRPLWEELRDHDDGRLSISMPFSHYRDAAPTILIGRRLTSVDKAFLGTVFVSVKMAQLESIYKVVDPIPDQTFSLFRTDGTLILRHPDTKDRSGAVLPPDSPFHATVRSGGGVYRSPGVFDGMPRWVAAFPMKHYDLVVSLTRTESALLAEWKVRFAVVLVGSLLFLTCVAVLLWTMARQYSRLDASEMALAAKADALEVERQRLLRNDQQLRDSRETLRLQNHRFAATLQNMSQGVVVFDANSRLVVCNQRYRDLLALSPEQAATGQSLRSILQYCHGHFGYPTDVEAHLQAMNDRIDAGQSQRIEAQDNYGRIISIVRDPLPDGGWVGTFEDVTERRQAEAKVERLAHSDLLTGLANRSRFLDEIERFLALLKSAKQPFSLMLLDLDRFKQVNDSLGHAAGDELLKQTAERLRSSVRAGDVVARLGGDEFAVIQGPPRDYEPNSDASSVMRESAIALVERMIEQIREPYDIGGQKIIIGVSVGIAIAPYDGMGSEQLFQNADLALYKSKADGRNGYSLFDEEFAREANERQAFEAELRAGIARNEFELHFQPIVDAASRRPCAMEALVRWRHPTRGMIMPDRFIPLAEDTGLITLLGDWILHTACAEAAGWPDDLKLSVNVSPVQFNKTNLLDVAMVALVESGLSPDRLEIEITERVILDHQEQNLCALHQLRNIGVSIVLDDFGTGYSSLSYLTRFPFDKVKIDRSFTSELLRKPESAAVVAAIVNLGRALDIPTVAEGVESEAQFQILLAAGVKQAQGYLFGRPQASQYLPLRNEATTGAA
jgi:diguanylate cyclase (GGDEF)-like protein